jgi:hypothetical protein
MKHLSWIIFAALVLLTTACSTTTFTEYRGQGIVEGKGGSVRKVGGIEFWADGEPDRKYQVIGVIDDSRGDSLMGGDAAKEIAKVAQEHGGDAVVLGSSSREFRRIDPNSGTAQYTKTTKVFVVRYVR